MSSASPYFNKETHITICDELMAGSTDLQIQTKLQSLGVPQDETLKLIDHVRTLTEQAKNMVVSPVPVMQPSFIPGPEGSYAEPIKPNEFPSFIDVGGQGSLSVVNTVDVICHIARTKSFIYIKLGSFSKTMIRKPKARDICNGQLID